MISPYEPPDRAPHFKPLPNLQTFRTTEISHENHFCLPATGQTVPIVVPPLTPGSLLTPRTSSWEVPLDKKFSQSGQEALSK